MTVAFAISILLKSVTLAMMQTFVINTRLLVVVCDIVIWSKMDWMWSKVWSCADVFWSLCLNVLLPCPLPSCLPPPSPPSPPPHSYPISPPLSILHLMIAHSTKSVVSSFWQCCKGLKAVNQSASSADQNTTINVLSEKPKHWLIYFPHRLKLGSRENDRLILNKTFQISIGTRSLMSRYTSYNQMKQLTVCIHMNAVFRLQSSFIPPVNTDIRQGGQIVSLRRKRWGLELNMEPSTVPGWSQSTTLWLCINHCTI